MQSLRIDPLRVHTMLLGEKRNAALATCARLERSIEQIDRDLAVLAERRRELAHELRTLRQRLTPSLGHRRGRQPGPDGSEQLPPVARDATPLWGRRLRSVCLAVLRSCASALPLPELHAVLHRRGYVVANSNHVKTLADALAYELEQGRVRRVSRGVYEIVPGPAPRYGQHGNPELRVA